MFKKTLTSLIASAVVATGLVAPGAASAAPPPAAACTFAPQPGATGTPFTAAQVAAPFSRPAPSDHIGLLSAFSSVSPLVTKQNLAHTVFVNQTAGDAVGQYAVRDAWAIGKPSIVNALGSRLAPAFTSALGSGKLPKTSELLFGKTALISGRTGTSKEKKYFHNPRPFEVAPQAIKRYSDGQGDLYEDVRGSGSYPSGHTTWGYTQAFLLADMFPEVGPQLLARGAEYGYHRIVLGVHYPLDVIGGRMLAEASTAEMMADPAFRGLLAEAKTEVRRVLTARVGAPIGRIVSCQKPYVATGAALRSYRERAVYSFLPTGPSTPVRVPAGAENLIRAAHPGKSDAQLRSILARTAIPGGHPLDGGEGGGWARLDLAKAWVAR